MYNEFILRGDLCYASVMCVDVPAEDKTWDKRGSFYKTLESTFEYSVTFKNNFKRKHYIFSNRKLLKTECMKLEKI